MPIPVTPDVVDTTLSDQTRANLRAIMGRRNLRRVDLVNLTEKNPSWVGRRLNGTHAMSIDDLGVFAAALEVTPADLLNGTAE